MKRTSLNSRERAVLKLLSQGVCAVEAVEKIYNVKSKGSAATIASRILKRPVFVKAMEDGGLDDKSIVQAFVHGLRAKKVLIVGGKVIEFADYQARLGYLKTALKIKNYLSDFKDNEESYGEPLIINAIKIIHTEKSYK